MAREKVKGFDASEFIESVRESAVPTYHTAADSAASTKDSPKTATAPEPTAEGGFDAVYVAPEDEVASKYSELNMTNEEIEYITTYIVKNTFKKVNQNGNPIMIREKHITMIKKILRLLNEDANMATYIDNVLTEHFKKYYPTIVDIYKKCPPQF